MEIIKTEDLRLYYGDFLALKGINISINNSANWPFWLWKIDFFENT